MTTRILLVRHGRSAHLHDGRWMHADRVPHYERGWSYRLAVRADHDFVRRADLAADWLIGRAANGENVVAVTHGAFRRIVARRLEARGWHADGRRLGYANWSVWSFIR